MVRWRGIVRAIIPALLLFSPIIIAIVYIGYSYIRGYGISIDSLLAIVILFQTYIIWIQVEIALRQTAVFKTEYEPNLKVNVTSFGQPGMEREMVSIQNIGKYPAYNLGTGLVDKITRKPLEKDVRVNSKALTTLAPNDSIDVLYMQTSNFYDSSIEMNVLYCNVLDEIRQVSFVKFPKSNDFIRIYAPLSLRQGILLKSLEDFKLAYQAVKWRKYPKKESKEK